MASNSDFFMAFDGTRDGDVIGFKRTPDGYTIIDETHHWRSSGKLDEMTERILRAGSRAAGARRVYWSNSSETPPPREEPILRIPPAERAGPAMIGDGVLRGQVTGIGWPKVLERLAAIDDGLLQLAKLHAPSVEENSKGKLCRPECQGCFDSGGCWEEWPCESATILLRRVGLTERDLDYQLGDADDGEAEGGL